MNKIILAQICKQTSELQQNLICHCWSLWRFGVMLVLSEMHWNCSVKCWPKTRNFSKKNNWRIRRKRIPLLFLHFSIFLLVSCTTCDNHLDLYLQFPLYSMCFNVDIYVNSYKIFQCFVSVDEKNTVLIHYKYCLYDQSMFTCIYDSICISMHVHITIIL